MLEQQFLDHNSGEIIYEYNPDKKFIASMTKIMTIIVLIAR